MSRQPTVGSDAGSWGTVLNDYLSVAHNADGTQKVDARTLIGWAESGAYSMTTAVRDANGIISSGTVTWPDGSTGVFTTTATDTQTGAINAYTITHPTNSLTVTQAAMTRDASGAVIAQPTPTVA